MASIKDCTIGWNRQTNFELCNRYSYATNLKQLGTSVELISQSMGHQNVSITSAYLKDFEDDIIDDANERLLMEPNSTYRLNHERRYSA